MLNFIVAFKVSVKAGNDRRWPHANKKDRNQANVN